jgi:hypothetical protein
MRLPVSEPRSPTPGAVPEDKGHGLAHITGCEYRRRGCVGPGAVGWILMTENKLAKKAARARMAATGEPYSVARRYSHDDPAVNGQYFVALVAYGVGPAGDGASVRDARTGAVTDLITPPPDVGQFSAVTSAGGGLFFLTGQDTPQPGRQIRGEPVVRTYRMRVDEAGRVEELEPLPEGLLPPGRRLITACPGGRTLAYICTDRRVPPAGSRIPTLEAGLVDLDRGERRPARLPAGGLGELSWAGDRRTVAFAWHPASGEPPGIYVTDTGATRDWVSAGQPVEAARGLTDDLIDPVISADGGEIYGTVAQPDPGGGPHWNRLLAIPVHGGQPRVLFQLRYRSDGHNVRYMWTTACRDATGGHLLVFATGYVYRIEASSAALTRLPFPEGRPYAAAW